MFSTPTRIAFVLAVLTAPSPGQAFLWEVDGDPTTSVRFGFRTICVGDIDDDGCDDFVVTDPFFSAPGSYGNGGFWVYSGRTQSLLWSASGSHVNGYVGRRMARLGDVDGDGYDEFAITSESLPRVDVYSARLGTILYSITTLWGGYFPALAATGDIDLDGVPDVLVGSIGNTSYEYLDAYLYSGKTGTELYHWSYVGGGSVAGAGDVDADGYPDVIIGNPFLSTGPLFQNGSVFVYSGKDGGLLRQIDGKKDARLFGVAVRGGSDLDGDGVPDLLIGTASSTPCIEYAYSGATWSEITQWTPSLGGFDDVVAEFAGDLDQDGTTDVLLNDGSIVHLISGRTRIDLYQLPNLDGCITTGDFNGDGVQDILVGDYGIAPVGAVQAYSAGTVFIDGDGSIGTHVTVRFLMRPNDGLLAIYGVPPPVSIPTPPFAGNLEIAPFTVLAFLPTNSWPYSEFDVDGDIPNDPTLSGFQVLFQGLSGPSFSPHQQNATWTNTATLTIK